MGSMVALPYFDCLLIECDSVLPDAVTDPAEKAVWAAFLELGSEQRLADSRHLYAYYREFHHIVGGQDWLDAKMGVPETPEAIWSHVHPKIIWAEKDRFDDMWFVNLEAECDWEEEHGVQMVWEEGQCLTKVGGFDGQHRNWFREPNGETALVVYNATDPRFRTLRDKI